MAARGTPFGADERAAARAALLYAMAFTARCEHSDLLTGFGTRPAEWHSEIAPRLRARTYTVTLDGEGVWPPPDSPFPPSTLRTHGARGAARIVFGSCRVAYPHETHMLEMSEWLVEYPFAERLYPGAL